MNRKIKVFAVTAMLTICMAVPAFAAETKKEYRAEKSEINAQIKELTEQVSAAREANKTAAQTYREIAQTRRETGELPVDKEVWKKEREIHSEISGTQRPEGDAQTVKDLRAASRAAADAGEYDDALDGLKKIVELKKAQLEAAQKTAAIWEQINALLGQ